MELFNTTNNELINLVINDPKTNTNMAGDIVGNSENDLTWNEEECRWEANAEICNWWEEFCNSYNSAYASVCEWKENANDEDVEYYNNFIGGVEFNDLPYAMEMFIKREEA